MNLLNSISIIYLISGVIASLIITTDVAFAHKQKMTIMNIVWPLTGLYFSIIGLWTYFGIGRKSSIKTSHNKEKPFWQTTFVATTHCGAGCAIGDVIGEFGIFLKGILLFNSKIATVYLVDFLLAYSFGVVFQYFSIVPMKKLSFTEGIKAAVKADTLSLIAFEVGMFGWMAFVKWKLPNLKPDSYLFWFLMQIAMIIGFCTSYPANWFLVKKGIKEKM